MCGGSKSQPRKMKDIFLRLLFLHLLADTAISWKWRSGACRREDRQHWSVESGRCRWTGDVYGPDKEWSNLTVCTGDEFTCPYPPRCISRNNLNTDTDCHFDRNIRTSLPCRQNEFVCNKTRRCVPRWAVSSEFPDCNDFEMEDDSDESSGPYDRCWEDEFRCPISGRCIPREWVIDGENDCPGEMDESGFTADEMKSLPFCRDRFEFRCQDSGRCMLRYRVMDDFKDCADGSDEFAPLPNCTEMEFRCVVSGRCIPRSWVLDGISNCPNMSDETSQVNVSCLKSEFLCHDGRRCVPRLYLCDGMQHCEDCSDEIEGCEIPRAWRCPGDPSICFLQSYACDPFEHCPNHTDTMSFLPGFKCSTMKIEDQDLICAIPQWMLYDDVSICSDKSDLCFDGGNFSCSRCGDGATIIANAQVCDSVADCIDLWDECLCPIRTGEKGTETLCRSICVEKDTNPCKECELGELFCQEDEKCLSREYLCDGTTDCPLSELDEKFCSKPVTQSNTKDKSYECQPLPALMDIVLKRFGAYEILKRLVPITATKCDGKLECLFFDDECSDDCEERPSQCDTIPKYQIDFSSYIPNAALSLSIRTCNDFDPTDPFDDLSFLGGVLICNGIRDCRGGEDERNCTGRMECNGGEVLFFTGERSIDSIDKNKICDLNIDCIDDKSDEIGCPEDTHYYCEGGKPLFVPRRAVMDKIQDCDDNSDECPISAYDNNAFSSREEMIRIPFLRHFIWVMAFFAILGNFGVFVETLTSEKKSKLSSMSRCNQTLILNLAISDFLMGVALLIIGIKSTSFSGNYCLQDDTWRTSGLCNATGIFIALSSEASVATLVLLTSYRLYGVYNPFASRHLKLRTVYIFIGVVWFSSLLIAILPVLPRVRDSAITQALIRPSRYFPSTRISWEEIQRFSSRAIVLGNITWLNPDNLGGWDGVAQLRQVPSMENHSPEILGYFGYYSADGVCIPRFFRLQGSLPLHPLSVFVIVVNFCNLLFIIISYVLIYKASSKKADSLRKSNSSDKQNAAIQRKITILIATDICCWLPICIMSILSQADVSVPNEAYAVAAIILLPINSSLNPFIYSNGLERTRKYVKTRILCKDK